MKQKTAAMLLLLAAMTSLTSNDLRGMGDDRRPKNDGADAPKSSTKFKASQKSSAKTADPVDIDKYLPRRQTPADQ